MTHAVFQNRCLELAPSVDENMIQVGCKAYIFFFGTCAWLLAASSSFPNSSDIRAAYKLACSMSRGPGSVDVESFDEPVSKLRAFVEQAARSRRPIGIYLGPFECPGTCLSET